jgi:hypothetical protein
LQKREHLLAEACFKSSPDNEIKAVGVNFILFSLPRAEQLQASIGDQALVSGCTSKERSDPQQPVDLVAKEKQSQLASVPENLPPRAEP